MKKILFIICLSTIVLTACNPKSQTLKINPLNIEAPLGGGVYFVHIEGSFDVSEWTASVDKDWVELSKTAGTASEDNWNSSYIVVTVQAGDEAVATLKITGESNFKEVMIYRKDIPAVNAVSGALPGKFSVSETKKVQFSQGNLQYSAFSNVWRFALHQYDIVGELNRYRTENYRGWIDLFMHGTSGYQDMQPWLRTANATDMKQYIYDTEYDWGKHNKISNGGNTKGIWHTPTMDEWEYILFGRTGAEVLRGAATVNQRSGFVLLPDNWITPSGVQFKANPADYTTNNYDLQQWDKMEKAGAVFFPETGNYDGYNYQEEGAGYSVSTIPFNTAYEYKYVWYFYHDGKSIACFIGGAIIDTNAEPVRLVKYSD